MKYCKFILLKKNTLKHSVITDSRSGSAFKNYSISSKRVGKDEKGKDIHIINAKGYDVFTNPEEVRDRRLFIKPQFSDGILTVPSDDSRTLEFLRAHPGNIDSPYKSSEDKPIFMEWDSVKVADEMLKKENETINLLHRVANMDYEKEVIPILMRFGYKSDWDSTSEAMVQLRMIAKKDPVSFKKIAEDTATTERVYDIAKAIDYGVINYSNGKFTRNSTGATICIVPPSRKDKMDYFAEFTYGKGEIEWHGIYEQLNKLTGDPVSRKNEEVSKAVEKEVESQATDLNDYSIDELLQNAQELGIKKWNGGKKTFTFGDSVEIKCKKEELADEIANNSEYRKGIIKEIIKKTNG